jgi:EmrB/QacA subfamily drug resistance transporter
MEYKWLALSNTTIGVLMSSLDINIVLIALPTIGKDLSGMTAFNVIWVILGYQLVISVVLVNFGRLSDLFGRVRLYTLGFALFTVGSALCGFAANADQIIGFRVIQATGAAFLFSNSAAILTDAFPLNERGKALGINQVSTVAGSVTGLVVGGLITSLIGWRWIFWVNIPIGIFATAWSYFKLKELSATPVMRSLDISGNITFALSVLLILLAVTMYTVSNLQILPALIMVVAAVMLLVLFVQIERRSRNPLFNLKLFGNRVFNAGNETIFLNALSRGSFTLVMVFYLQGPLMGFSPLEAGIFLIPMSIALSIMGPISGSISDRIGYHKPVIIGLLVSAAGFILLAGIGPSVTEFRMLIPLVLIGGGMGIFASPNRSSIMNSVPITERGFASGISATFVNVGNTMSIGIAFLIMELSTPKAVLDAIFSGQPISSAGFSASMFVSSVHLVFLASAFMILASVAIYLIASSNSGVRRVWIRAAG